MEGVQYPRNGRERRDSFKKEGGSIQVMTCIKVVYSEDSVVNQRRRRKRWGMKSRGETQRKVLVLRVWLVPPTGMQVGLDEREKVCNGARKR
jgi:hypothetical protein